MGKKLEAARKELQMAERAIGDMRSAGNSDALDLAWKDYLGRLTRIWNKTEAALKGDPKFYSSTRYKEANRLRRDDELLLYLAKARDADEHTVGDVTAKIPAAFHVNAPMPGGMLYIRSMELKDGRLKIDAPTGAKITFKADEVVPLPATTRGRTYPLPTRHGDIQLGSSIYEYAELGLKYYADFIEGMAADGWDVEHQ